MTVNSFSPAFADAILQQKKEGTICAACGKTEIEHCFEPSKCCGKRTAFKRKAAIEDEK